MLSGFYPYHLYLSINNRTTIENMERNGRLLSLPARAESALSAGTLQPRDAGLPERSSRNAPPLLSNRSSSTDPYQSSHNEAQTYLPPNPFLPSYSASQIPFQPQSSSSHNYEVSASHSLSRLQRRQLERKAGQINIYDLGTYARNFEEVFGGKWYQIRSWVPLGRSRGSGYEYPVNKGKLNRLRRLNDELRYAGNSGY